MPGEKGGKLRPCTVLSADVVAGQLLSLPVTKVLEAKVVAQQAQEVNLQLQQAEAAQLNFQRLRLIG